MRISFTRVDNNLLFQLSILPIIFSLSEDKTKHLDLLQRKKFQGSNLNASLKEHKKATNRFSMLQWDVTTKKDARLWKFTS